MKKLILLVTAAVLLFVYSYRSSLANKFFTDAQIKAAAREVWIQPEDSKNNEPHGWDCEFEHHWNYGRNLKRSNRSLWDRTIYPQLEDEAIKFLVLHSPPKARAEAKPCS